MTRRRIRFALALLVSGCAASSTFDGRVYRSGQVHFEIGKVPPNYRPIKVEGATLAYRDDTHDASISIKARCGVASDDAPLEALTNHLLMGTTEREFLSAETIPFDGREARRSVVSAKLDGVPMVYRIYVLKKDGCVYDFVRVTPPAHAEPGAPEFHEFVSGFRTIGGGAT
jgi:hypothetical protein